MHTVRSLVALSIVAGLAAAPIARPAGTAEAAADSVVISIDKPSPGDAAAPTVIAGWAVDTAATSGTGIATVTVFLDGDQTTGSLLGQAVYGGERPDVASSLGENFRNAGFALDLTGVNLAAGAHSVTVVARSAANGPASATVSNVTFAPSRTGSTATASTPNTGSTSRAATGTNAPNPLYNATPYTPSGSTVTATSGGYNPAGAAYAPVAGGQNAYSGAFFGLPSGSGPASQGYSAGTYGTPNGYPSGNYGQPTSAVYYGVGGAGYNGGYYANGYGGSPYYAGASNGGYYGNGSSYNYGYNGYGNTYYGYNGAPYTGFLGNYGGSYPYSNYSTYYGYNSSPYGYYPYYGGYRYSYR